MQNELKFEWKYQIEIREQIKKIKYKIQYEMNCEMFYKKVGDRFLSSRYIKCQGEYILKKIVIGSKWLGTSCYL